MASLISKASKLDSIDRTKIAAGKALVATATKYTRDEILTFVRESAVLASVALQEPVTDILGNTVAEFDGTGMRVSGSRGHDAQSQFLAMQSQLVVSPVGIVKPAPATAPVA